MHEESLIRTLLRQVEQVATAESASRVTAVHVWCGALSHFNADHFREHFDRAAAGTVAQGADVAVVVSDDATHPDAAHVRLESLDVER